MAKKIRYTREETIDYIIRKNSADKNKTVNIFFYDKFLTYIVNKTSVGKRYLYRVYYYVMYEKEPELFPEIEVLY